VQVFLFATRLTNVSGNCAPATRTRLWRAAGAIVKDWRRTRIADALHDFNRDWSRSRPLGGADRAVVTDGSSASSIMISPSRWTGCTAVPSLGVAQPTAALWGFEARAAAFAPCCRMWTNSVRSTARIDRDLCEALKVVETPRPIRAVGSRRLLVVRPDEWFPFVGNGLTQLQRICG